MAEVMLSTSSYIWVAKGSGVGNLTYEVGYWRAYSGGEVKFKVESRWTDKESAAHRVSFLNGLSSMASRSRLTRPCASSISACPLTRTTGC